MTLWIEWLIIFDTLMKIISEIRTYMHILVRPKKMKRGFSVTKIILLFVLQGICLTISEFAFMNCVTVSKVLNNSQLWLFLSPYTNENIETMQRKEINK